MVFFFLIFNQILKRYLKNSGYPDQMQHLIWFCRCLPKSHKKMLGVSYFQVVTKFGLGKLQTTEFIIISSVAVI